MDFNLCFREKPKIIKAADNKNASSDGEPEAKRRKVHITETMVVQKVFELSNFVCYLSFRGLFSQPFYGMYALLWFTV